MARSEKAAKPAVRKGKAAHAGGPATPEATGLEQWQETFRFYLEKEGISPKQAMKLVRLAGSR